MCKFEKYEIANMQWFDVELRKSPESTELLSGATIHAKNEMWCKLKKTKKMLHILVLRK